MRCCIKYRDWKDHKGLTEKEVEVKSLEELFHELSESSERAKIHSVILEGKSSQSETLQLSLEITSLIKKKL